MNARSSRGLAALAVAAALPMTFALATPALAAEKTSTGPSSSQSPYLLPVAPGVSNTSVLTVGDKADNGYQMAGIPDGLGAYDNGDGTVTILMNHELGAKDGAVHAHGATGSFVSEWVIDRKTLEVKSGDDLIKKLILADPALGQEITRMCSGDLPSKSAFYAKSGKGYNGRIFMNGEEDAKTGRAFAHVATGSEAGTSYEVAAMGNSSWENVVANPSTGDKTVLIGLDDSTPGQLYMYVGDKKSSGNAIEKAGLTGGVLYGLQADGGKNEYDKAAKAGNSSFPMKGKLGAANLGDVSKLDTEGLQELSDAKSVTEWWRPEDGAWDVNNHNVFYFNTTADFDGPSRTWKLTFVDAAKPELGGTFEALLDGTEGQHMLDNMAAAHNGKQLILNEDPGKQDYLARVYSYNLHSDRKTAILEHDPARFGVGGAKFLTTDEESSATIDVSDFFGQGTFLLTTQAHYKLGNPLVEGGQLQLLRVPRVEFGQGSDQDDKGSDKGTKGSDKDSDKGTKDSDKGSNGRGVPAKTGVVAPQTSRWASIA